MCDIFYICGVQGILQKLKNSNLYVTCVSQFKKQIKVFFYNSLHFAVVTHCDSALATGNTRTVTFSSNIKGYKNHLKTNLGTVELTGRYNQQIKPVFDIDTYNIEPDINELLTDIN
jgi:hypothetical protein